MSCFYLFCLFFFFLGSFLLISTCGLSKFLGVPQICPLSSPWLKLASFGFSLPKILNQYNQFPYCLLSLCWKSLLMEQRLDNDNLNVISQIHFPNWLPGMKGMPNRMKGWIRLDGCKQCNFARISLSLIGLNQGCVKIHPFFSGTYYISKININSAQVWGALSAWAI